ncbi:MAG TPA: phosphonopyruvate decarboxylase [Candidatus Atribacteria bacterium]|nr:phosphonopyruvate decarboxylase [Candidatus Atribacteria bacterium]
MHVNKRNFEFNPWCEISMISCTDLFRIFQKNGLTFFTGIPDSTFKGWMSFLERENGRILTQITVANECEAVAIAMGYYLSTKKVAVVYMQNSGLGKTVNPITSLCDPEVYSIPMILMIGWRGEPGKKDEPQHKKMGRIMINLLETMEIPYELLPESSKEGEKVITTMKNIAIKQNTPVALIIRRGVIEENSGEEKSHTDREFEMTREEAIKIIVDSLDETEVVVSTTGKTSRELFEYRIERNEIPHDFYTVGGMGCAASIALSIAIQKPEKKIFVFDGDGAIIMQMGSLATIGHYRPSNFYHILFDNQVHDSTGGQKTLSETINFEKVALACGYNNAITVRTKTDLKRAIRSMKKLRGPQMLIVKIKRGSRKNLGRPTTTPIENKKKFMKTLERN